MATDRVASRPILVGVDFSSGSEEAFDWAVDAAIAFDARLIALHVVHDPADAPGYYNRPADERPEEFERVAQEMMSEFLARSHERVPRLGEVRSVDSVVVVGLPITRIIEVAQREDVGLIVMGAQGRTALADALLGSKADRVTRLSPVPVTIVKHARPVDGGTPES